MILSITTLLLCCLLNFTFCYAECLYAESSHAECQYDGEAAFHQSGNSSKQLFIEAAIH
jgi:hypothetical protein